jgi:hypothetical protein
VKTIEHVTIDLQQLDRKTVKTSVRNEGQQRLAVVSPAQGHNVQIDGDCVCFARVLFHGPPVKAYYIYSPISWVDCLAPGEVLENVISLEGLEERDEAKARELREKSGYKSSRDERETTTVSRARFVVEAVFIEPSRKIEHRLLSPPLDDAEVSLGWKEIALERAVEVSAYRRVWW